MSTHQAVFLLLGLAVVVVSARLAGALAARLGQPPVIGEIVAGILLGPSVLGAGFSGALFPDDVRPMLDSLANIGIALFMFGVGVEFDRRLVRGRGRSAAVVSGLSVAAPFAFGAALALLLIRWHPHPDRLGFMLFVGVAMSITAFPVLARILTDLRLRQSEPGVLAISCAAIGDVLAWALLAAVTVLVGAGGDEPWRPLLFVPYVLVMVLALRPLLARLLGRIGGGTAGPVVVLAGLLVSSALTEWMGMHLIFGAFLFGLLMPRREAAWVRDEFVETLGKVGNLLLLPVFFLAAGLKVDLSGIGWRGVGELALVLVAAVVGKFGAAYVGARLTGVPKQEAAATGALLNTRGLTELVVLSVGLQLGILDTQLYSIMVVMAVLTTMMAAPLLRAFYLRRDEPPLEPTPSAVRSPRAG